MNIFEGARRIAKITAALIVVGFGFAIIDEQPSPVSVSYLIEAATKPPVRVKQCEVSSASRTKEITSKSGDIINATLCFKFHLWELDPVVVAKYSTADYMAWKNDGKPKSPIEIAEHVLHEQDYIDGNEATKIKIRALILEKYKVNLDDLEILYAASPPTYASLLLDVFTIPKADQGYITRLVWLQKAQSVGLGFMQMLATLAGFWLFVWTIGWIVRGFKGIPQGKDSLE